MEVVQKLVLGDSTWQEVKETTELRVVCAPGGSMTKEGEWPPREEPWLFQLARWYKQLSDRPIRIGVIPGEHSVPASSKYRKQAEALNKTPLGEDVRLSPLTYVVPD